MGRGWWEARERGGGVGLREEIKHAELREDKSEGLSSLNQ